jgi:hypothetical protein
MRARRLETSYFALIVKSLKAVSWDETPIEFMIRPTCQHHYKIDHQMIKLVLIQELTSYDIHVKSRHIFYVV